MPEMLTPHDRAGNVAAALTAAGANPETTVGYYTPPSGPAVRTWFSNHDGTYGCVHSPVVPCTSCQVADEALMAKHTCDLGPGHPILATNRATCPVCP